MFMIAYLLVDPVPAAESIGSFRRGLSGRASPRGTPLPPKGHLDKGHAAVSLRIRVQRRSELGKGSHRSRKTGRRRTMRRISNEHLDALISGTIAGIATTLAAAACSKAERSSAVAPLNAVSHVTWGNEAARHTDVSLKYTGTGFVLNHAAAVLWATLYERWFGRAAESGDVAGALTGGAVVAGLAYLTDYHLVPERLTPGFEKRLSGRSLAAVFGALALSLPLRGLLQRLWR
jgi:hypothetical protein